MSIDFEEETAERRKPLRRLGRYQLLEKLAEGGMGAVYVAYRDGADHLCVLKQLHLGMSKRDIAVKRFYREAVIGAQLTHPRIAAVLGAGTEDGVFCIAMELVAGLDLGAMTTGLAASGFLLPTEMVLHVALGALDALGYAHEARSKNGQPLNLVHRDITPRNVMVGLDGEVKLIDFGLVRASGDDLRTRPGAFLGTPRFASPEQAMGGAIDRRSDIYSLSTVLFECLTGVPTVRAGPLPDMLASIMRDEPPLIHAINPVVPPALSAIIARGLAKDPGDRWPDARSYASAIAPFLPRELNASDIGAFVRASFPVPIARIREIFDYGKEFIGRSSLEEGYDDAATVSGNPFDEGEDGTGTFVEFSTGSMERSMVRPIIVDIPESQSSLLPTRAPHLLRGPSKPAGRERSREGSSGGLLRTIVVATVAAVAGSIVTAALLIRSIAPAPPVVLPAPSPTVTPIAPAILPVPAIVPAIVPVTPSPTTTARPAPSSPRPRPSPTPSPVAPSPVAPAPPPPPPPASPAVSPLMSQLEAYEKAQTDAAREEIIRAFAAHPQAARIQRELMFAKQGMTHPAVIKQLRAAITKLEQ